MSVNDYGNEIEKWKVELIFERARKLGFRKDELEDVQQELILDVIAFEYDQSRSNGATERTALTSLIDHRLKTIRRSQRRYQDHIERLEPAPEVDARQDIEHQQRRIDVKDAVNSLPEEDQKLCRALSEGRSISEIAKANGRGWHTGKRRVNHIRKQFADIGIDAWSGSSVRLLVKPAEAAEALAISPRKLWAMTNAGEIPCVRLGRSVRYDLDDLRAWIGEQKRTRR